MRWLSLLLALALLPAAPTRAATPEAARLNNTGVALMDQQLVAKALERFIQAHQSDPAAPIPLLNQGLALLYLHRLPEAEQTLQAAAAANPSSANIWYSLGIARFDAGDQPAALQAFQHAVALNPADASTHYYIGAIELATGSYPAAAAEFTRALAITPLHASAQYGLARALLRLNQTEQSRQHLARFQHITQSGIGTLLSSSYGEQGPLATAQPMLSPHPAAAPMIPVRFVPTGPAGGPAQPAAGACVLNLTGDHSTGGLTAGAPAILTLSTGPTALHAWRLGPTGAPVPVDLTHSGLQASGRALACAVGDYDNDGLPDLAIALQDRVLLFHNLGHGRFADSTAAAGLRPLNHPQGLTFVDFDHDGDLDLFLTGSTATPGGGPNVLWRNNGNSTFTEWTGPTGLAGTAPTASATLSDINNDRAVDLVVAGAATTLYENQREGAFHPIPLPTQSPSRGVLAFDFDKDGWMDLALTHSAAPALTLWRNLKGERFEPVPLPIKDATAAWGLTAIDFDNDGWIDLAAIVETPRGARLRVFRNLGDQGFEDVSTALGLADLDVTGARTLLAADLDSDGAPDLILPRGDAPPLLLHNAGGSRNHSLRLNLLGLADNKLALGTQVEVLANGASQKFEVAGASGYLGQNSTEILAGLGPSDHADVVRMLWPTGVPQDELDLASSQPVTLHELDRRGSSCPVLFAWNGRKYRFVSDVIGAAVVGHWMSPTTRNQSDSDEWIKVDGASLKPLHGLLSLRFGEPMEEINYIDQLRLVAVDHPPGTQVYPDERFLSEKPFASGTPILASTETRLPAGAWGDRGQNVLPLLAHRDHRYVRDFHNLSYGGFATPHTLTLDLGPWTPAHPLRLFLHGFIEYFSASSMYSAWQAGLTPQPPSLEAQLPSGAWKTILPDMGFPAGLPRTITVDLSGKLPPGTRRIRIRTNLQIYWDQALVDNGAATSASGGIAIGALGVASSRVVASSGAANDPLSGAAHAPAGIRQSELPLALATVQFRGYPEQIDGATPGDLTYNYRHISSTGPFQWQRGSYTRYGPVTPLLQAKDDHDVIFGSGEEIDAEFSTTALPALPPHWQRDYFFYADGYVKDMDFYEAAPFTVAQLPFHRMTRYPYPPSEHYPDTLDTLRYQLDWNTRTETGTRKQLFQFHYQPTATTPIQPSQ